MGKADQRVVDPVGLRLVVLGASAGGLDALLSFFGGVDAESNSAFVVAQHLAPTHPTLLVDLLAPASRLAVRLAEDGDELRPGTVYVVPPDRDVTVTRSHIQVTPAGERAAPRPSINRLFHSAAEAWGDGATAVLLSGTGSDGAEGLRAVRGAGGVTMVQSPDTARFPGMPAAALAMTAVDLVAGPAELAARVDAIAWPENGESSRADTARDMFRPVIAQLRRSVNVDFSGYKESTLRRQVHRRMAVVGAESVDDYFGLLASDPQEARRLADNLLVTVTEFFRDQEGFAKLRSAAASMLLDRPTDTPIRIWVPGCATGEEAFSIAMVVADLLGRPANLPKRLRVFGTDLDEASLTVARKGHYPTSALERIPAEFRSEFVVEDSEGISISDELRSCVVFARHDVSEDPPFPRIDLVSCRNTLIYFTETLQRRVLTMFAYSLHDGGLLFLGKAENIDRDIGTFEAVDPQWRIFRRTDKVAERPEYPVTGASTRYSRALGPTARVPVAAIEAGADHDELLEALVRSSGRRFMVVDESLDLVEVVGDVTAYCRVPEGRATTSVLALLLPALSDEARALGLLAKAEGGPVAGVPIAIAQGDRVVQLTVTPLRVGDRDLQVLEFAEPPDTDHSRPVKIDREISSNEIIRHLESQLDESRTSLRRSLLDLQVTNEELEASSEELQASSEELQAANEELESSNEELRATNEELGMLNQTLRSRSEQLEGLNAVLESIQEAQNQGMVVVDHDGAVVKFTPSAVRLFGLMDSDVGRPLVDVPTTIPIPGLAEALAAVANGSSRLTIEALGTPMSYLVQVLPFHSIPGASDGCIITLTDISEMADLRASLEDYVAELERSEEKLQKQATYDSVTGLLNRGAFSAVATREIARSVRAERPMALVWVDVDRFKEINDGYGHDVGDMALRACGERIVAAVREADFVGRLGGDEFGVLLTDYRSDAELDAIVERMVSALGQPLETAGHFVRMSASLGVALCPADGRDGDELMRAADAAMYVAKRLGGDRHAYFDETMNVAADERRTFRSRMDAAIRDHEFTLHYQPIVTVPDRRVWGAEALLRWGRDGDVLPAGQFIPQAEETGQIRPLGMESLTLMRADLAQLRGTGAGDLTLTLNLSVLQLEDPALSDLVDHWPIPGGLEGMAIEILESSFLPERAHALAMVHRLSELGAQVAVDDYGSGYSNLKLLQGLAPDFLKLDRSFLSTGQSPEMRRALVSSVVVLAGVLGAQVIAEGVETQEEWDFVASAGVDLAQGRFIAEPMAMDALISWLPARTSGASGLPIQPRHDSGDIGLDA